MTTAIPPHFHVLAGFSNHPDLMKKDWNKTFLICQQFDHLDNIDLSGESQQTRRSGLIPETTSKVCCIQTKPAESGKVFDEGEKVTPRSCKPLKNLIFIALCTVAWNSHAESLHPSLDDTWQFHVGLFQQNNKLEVSSTRLGDQEFDIDLDDLGLSDSESVPQFGIRWDFSEHWGLNFFYSDFGLTSNAVNNSEFIYDGVVYPLNASLKTEFDITVYALALDYAFYKSNTTEIGIGVGIHALDLAAGFEGSLNDIRLTDTEEDFLAPLPNIRGYVQHAFSPKFLGSLNFGWMGADIDNYSGSFLVASASLEYRLAKRWSVIGNYQLTSIDFEVTE